MGLALHSTSRQGFEYCRVMLAAIPLEGRRAAQRSQGGAPPPGGDGRGGYGPPGGYAPPGGHGPPGGYGPPGGHGPPGGYGPPGPPPHQAKPITGSASTMAMHAMTIDPKTGLPRGEKPPASTASVVSLVCGILLCLGPFTGLPAIVFGVLARKEAREKPDRVGGRAMATAGISLGALNLFISLCAGVAGLYSIISP